MRGKESESGSGIAWLALALAIVAMVLAVVAYYRSGGPPLEQQVAREVDEATTMLREQVERIERTTEKARRQMERRAHASQAREALLEARAAIAERGDVERIRDDLDEARDGLQAMFEGQSDGARERWQALRTEIERAEEALGKDAATAFESVSRALARLDREIERQTAEARRSDEPEASP